MATAVKEREETQKAVVVAKEEEKKIRPKIRKLGKKLELVPATEAVDEPSKAIEQAIEKDKKKSKKTKATEVIKPKKTKLLIIEESDED